MTGPAPEHAVAPTRPSTPTVFAAGALIGVLGGLIGLGGAEFRLPLLIGIFGFAALHAVILNKAISLIVVTTALPARLVALPAAGIAAHWSIVVNLLAGSLLGAWLGASWATRMQSRTLYRVLAGLLVVIATALLANHFNHLSALTNLPSTARVLTAVIAGAGIGVVAALMGVAGGELLIPTIVLLFAIDIKTAGSLALLVSLPTMLVAFARYSQDQSFHVLRDNTRFVATMAAGSIIGTLLGAMLLGLVSVSVLVPALAALLIISAIKVWRHR
jgi:uncharacterized membrane protein YfcA